MIPGGVALHQVFKGEEPYPVRLGFAEKRDGAASVETMGEAVLGGQLANTVDRSAVELVLKAMRLCLETNPDMFDWRGQERIGDPCNGSRGVVLRVGELWVGVERLDSCIVGFKPSPGFMKCAKLHRDLMSNRMKQIRTKEAGREAKKNNITLRESFGNANQIFKKKESFLAGRDA